MSELAKIIDVIFPIFTGVGFLILFFWDLYMERRTHGLQQRIDELEEKQSYAEIRRDNHQEIQNRIEQLEKEIASNQIAPVYQLMLDLDTDFHRKLEGLLSGLEKIEQKIESVEKEKSP